MSDLGGMRGDDRGPLRLRDRRRADEERIQRDRDAAGLRSAAVPAPIAGEPIVKAPPGIAMMSRPAPAPRTSVKTLALADWVGRRCALGVDHGEIERDRSQRRWRGRGAVAGSRGPPATAPAAATATRRRAEGAPPRQPRGCRAPPRAGSRACERGSAGAVSPAVQAQVAAPFPGRRNASAYG